MAMQQQKTRATYEDYLNTPEGERYELLDGELVMVPAPNIWHQRVAGRMLMLLHPYVERMGLGEVFIAPFDVKFLHANGVEIETVQPDLLFVSAARASIITEANVQGAPDLVVEILSPSTESRDRGYKREIYARNGVGEYWQVDPNTRSITVLLLGDGDYDVAATYGPGDTLTSPALPGLNLRLGEVFP